MSLDLSRPSADDAPSFPAGPRAPASPPQPMLDADNLSDRVHLRLREAMMRGELTPHQRLKPRDIASALGISETPVREALQRLAQEGLVEIERRRSMRVRRFTLPEYLEMRDIREPLEMLAARRAMPALRGPALAELRALHEAIDRARAAEDWDTAHQANFDFHFGIYRRSDMPALIGMLETLWTRSGPIFAEYYHSAPPRYSARHPHLDALDAIEADDADALAGAVLRDIREGSVALAAQMEARRAHGTAGPSPAAGGGARPEAGPSPRRPAAPEEREARSPQSRIGAVIAP